MCRELDSDDKVVKLKTRNSKIEEIVGYFGIIRNQQGYQAAVDYFYRVTPIQLREAVGALINQRFKEPK